ncbi:uncharacterized protein RCO7_14736 [Rhynchosporium graminicola]|uniref:Uncharacterized protein n=2 Tax=Rhynchosporium TaxID=38037 RepID=A0A1E1MJ33_RHYSE|nr:uncharacterized protein RCO7_14736 [Rhynchosporium commune]CZT49118.1 uncharacterized protein RSE6_09912 [Rhynchosporium secalis]
MVRGTRMPPTIALILLLLPMAVHYRQVRRRYDEKMERYWGLVDWVDCSGSS